MSECVDCRRAAGNPALSSSSESFRVCGFAVCARVAWAASGRQACAVTGSLDAVGLGSTCVRRKQGGGAQTGDRASASHSRDAVALPLERLRRCIPCLQLPSEHARFTHKRACSESLLLDSLAKRIDPNARGRAWRLVSARSEQVALLPATLVASCCRCHRLVWPTLRTSLASHSVWIVSLVCLVCLVCSIGVALL